MTPWSPLKKPVSMSCAACNCKRMKWSLEHAYANVEMLPEEIRCRPASTLPTLRELGDLSKFPLTDKHDMRANYPFGMFAVPMDDIVRLHASSGTTGKPVVVGYSRNDIDMWSRVVARSFRAAGASSPGQDTRGVRLWFVYRRSGRSLRG